jgi:hypothetical protein
MILQHYILKWQTARAALYVLHAQPNPSHGCMRRLHREVLYDVQISRPEVTATKYGTGRKFRVIQFVKSGKNSSQQACYTRSAVGMRTSYVWCAAQLSSRLYTMLLPLDPRVADQTRPRIWGFKGNQNPQHTFLWMGSKAGGPMS